MKRKELAREQAKERILQELDDAQATLQTARVEMDAEDFISAAVSIRWAKRHCEAAEADLQQFLPGE
jgi:hypothetical protein